MERNRYEPMPSRRVQLIKRGSDRNPYPIVATQFFPRLAGFVFRLFVSHRDGLIATCAATSCRPPPTNGRQCHDSVLDATRSAARTEQPTWQVASAQAAPAQARAGAAHQAADWDCQEAAAPSATAALLRRLFHGRYMRLRRFGRTRRHRHWRQIRQRRRGFLSGDCHREFPFDPLRHRALTERWHDAAVPSSSLAYFAREQ